MQGNASVLCAPEWTRCDPERFQEKRAPNFRPELHENNKIERFGDSKNESAPR